MITASVSRKAGRLVALVLSIAVVAGIASPAKAAAATQLSTNASALVGWNAPTQDLNLLTQGASQTLTVSSASASDPLVATDVVSVSSDDTTVVDVSSGDALVPTDATPDALGKASYTIQPLNPGTAHLTFSSGSIGEVVVTVNVADPSLSASKSPLNVEIGQNYPLSISSLNLPMPAGTSVDVVSSDSDTLTTVEPTLNTDANGTAVFHVSGLLVGSETLTFRALNYADVNVAVNIVDAGAGVLTPSDAVTNLLSGAAASNVSFTSANVDLVPGTVFTVASTDTTVVDVPETVTVNAAGALSLPVTPLTAGSSDVTLSSPLYADATATISVTDPALNASRSAIQIIAGRTQSVTISSSAVKLLGGIDAVTADSDVASFVDSSVNADANGNAVFTLNGLSEGSTTVTFNGANYQSLTLNVDVWTTPTLVSDSSALTLWTGDVAEPLTISSDQVGLNANSAVTVSSSDPTVVNVADTLNANANGEAVFSILPISTGVAELTFSQDGYADVTVIVTVNDPALTASGPVAVITGRSKTITLTSADLAIAAGTVVDAVSSDSDVASVSATATASAAGILEFTVTGVSEGTASLTFTSADHKNATVDVAVWNVPTIISETTGTQSLTTGDVAADLTVSSDQVPFTVGSVVSVSSTDTTVVDVPDTAVVDADGNVSIKVAPLTAGQATVTFSQDGYADYSIDYTVVDPALMSGASALNLIAGRSGTVVISSDDLKIAAGNSIDAVSSDSDVAGITPTAFADANGNVTFTVNALTEGSATLTFVTANYGTVSVPVSVWASPLMVSDQAASLALTTGDVATVATITSEQVPFAPGSVVSVDSTDTTVVNVADSLTVNADGEVSLSILPTSSGSATLTLSQAGYTDLSISVTVADPALMSDAATLTLIAGRTGTATINSEDLPLVNGTVVDALSSDSDVASLAPSATAANGDAVFTIRALSAGDVTLTFAVQNYGSVQIAVTVVVPALASDVQLENGASVINTITGADSTVLTVSSADFPLADNERITVSSSDPTVVDVVDTLLPTDGEAAFSIKPLSSGLAVLTFSAADYTELTVTVNVADPRLVSSQESLDLFMGHSDSLVINSDDLGLLNSKVIDVTSTDSDVASLSATSLNAANGDATFVVTAIQDGTTDLQFTTADYQSVTVRVTVSTPKLAAEDVSGSPVSSLALRAGLVDGQVVINSADLGIPQGVAIVAESSNTDAATLSGSGIADADGNIRYNVTAVADGNSVLTFSLNNYTSVSVNVTVTTPALATDASADVTVFPGFDDATITVSSSDFALADASTVNAVAVPDSAITVEPTASTADGQAVFHVHAVSAGEADVTFTSPNYGEVTVHVVSVVPTLASNNDSLDLFKSQTGTININSAELGLVGDVTAVSSDATTATVDESATPADGIAAFTVTALKDGIATLTFSSANYTDVQVTINVTTPALIADNSSLDVFASSTALVAISSDDLGLTGDVTVNAASSSETIATVESTDGDEGTATFSVSALAVGTATLTFSADNYESVTVQVNVIAPALIADPTSVEVLVGDSTTIDIASDDLPLNSVTVNGTSRNTKVATLESGSVDSNNEVASFTVNGVFPGITTLTFATGLYTSVTVTVTVLAPALVADPTSIDVMANTSTTIDITSDEFALGDGRLVVATSNAPGVATADVAEVTSTGDVATFTINALSKGKVTLKFASRGYKTVSVLVNVTLPALSTDTTTITVPAGGGSTTIDIVSNDVALGDATVTGTSSKPEAVTVGADAESAADTADVSATSDAATFTVVGLVKGTYKVTFTAANYIPVVVKVIVVTPLLTTDVTSVNIFVGGTADINIGSDDLPIGDGRPVNATGYNEAKIDFSNDGGNAVSSAGDNATFTVHGLEAGKTKITFTSDNFKSVVVTVVVMTPVLVASPSTLTLTAGTTASVDITSDDFGLGDGRTVSATAGSSDIATVDGSVDSLGDVSTFTITGASKGTTTLVFHSDGYKDVKVKVVVLAPALVADNSAIEVFAAGGTGTVKISSDDLALADDTTITARTVKADDVVTVDSEMAATGGKATFTVTGVRKGKTKITFTNSLYKSVVVTVNVVAPSLVASQPALQVLVGGTTTFTVSSNDVALADGAAFTATPSIDTVSVVDPEIANGVATFTLTGLKKGKAKVAISTENYGKLSVTVNVIEPVLTSNATAGLTLVAGTTGTLRITSSDVPLADDATIEVTGGDDTVATLSDPVITNGVAEYVVTAVAAGRLTLNFKVANYVATKVTLNINPSPVCKPAVLGSLKFGDTDAKLTPAALASVTKFADSVKKSNCSIINLTTYVPVANTKATAVAYGKEVTLSNQRALAVRGALTTALAKAKVTITVTININKGTVPNSVLVGPVAGQSAYRKVDVEVVAPAIAPAAIR